MGNTITRVIATAFPNANIYFTYYASEQKAKELMSISGKLKGIQCDFTSNNDVAAICKLISDDDIDVLPPEREEQSPLEEAFDLVKGLIDRIEKKMVEARKSPRGLVRSAKGWRKINR